MKNFLLKLAKRSVAVNYFVAFRNLRRRNKKMSLLSFIKAVHIVTPYYDQGVTSYAKQLRSVFKRMSIRKDLIYSYPYDHLSIRSLPLGTQRIVSVTPDYSTILNSTLSSINNQINHLPNSEFKSAESTMVKSIDYISKRCGCNMLMDSIPLTFKEAIQKYLFYNALFWQANHWHNGCGRLDLVLYPYYKRDLDNGTITKEEAKEQIKEMVRILGKDTKSKSFSLIGDTGQYILLGGVDEIGETVQNDLTELFLEVITEMNLPDPKLILRVNDDTSDIVWNKAIKCLSTGCGSPLIVNECVVMESMVEFGYGKEDVWNFGTSACWEPLIQGKSFDQNNPMSNIPIIQSLNSLLYEKKDFETFESLMCELKQCIKKQIEDSIHDIKFDVSPLLSLFFCDCLNRGKDFTLGGAKYAWHGIQIVSLPNLINALLNIKKYVFEDKIIPLDMCIRAIKSNYDGYEDIRSLMKSNPIKYGLNSEYVVGLTNELQLYMSEVASRLTINGNRIKIGFSSSQYIERSKDVGATLDGRKDGDPFAVHISPVSQKIDLQEIFDFAGRLDYGGNRINGNVVDFIIPQSLVKNPDKLRSILKNAIKNGVFEIQINVLSATTLRDAKMHPEKYPNLIVRVWGFSAYFNDLPEEYKDNMISRAEINEAS